MNKYILTICLLLVTNFMTAQEWGTVDKNKVTMKEIAPGSNAF